MLTDHGDVECRYVPNSPSDGVAGHELLYLLAINAAEQSVDIATPYFVPTDPLSEALIAAARRGVRIRLLMPGQSTDSDLARAASKVNWTELLEADVEIHEYQPAMYHCKGMIVDGMWTAVGSTNLDPRSLRLNEEANVHVLDSAFARQQQALFEEDLKSAIRVTEFEHRKRSIFERFSEVLAFVFSPLL
jgi:cardiolipin synthase